MQAFCTALANTKHAILFIRHKKRTIAAILASHQYSFENRSSLREATVTRSASSCYKVFPAIRHTISLALLLLLTVTANSRPQTPAAQLLDSAFTAMGGREHLTSLHSLKLDLRTILYRIDDSEQSDASPWVNVDIASEWRDEDAARYRSESDDASAQWLLNKTIEIDDGRTRSKGVRVQNVWHWSAQPSLGERLALSPERILFTAAAAPDLKQEPDATVNNEPQDVLSFTWKGFPTRLYLDKALHLPTRWEQRRASPLERASVLLGDIDWRADFLFYKPETSGLVYPHQWILYRDGQEYITAIVIKLQENVAPPADAFTVPADANLDLNKAAVASYADLPIPTPKSGDVLHPLGPPESNVWEIAGNWNVLIVKQPDGLVVIECPQSSNYSDRIIALLAERFPSVPIKAVISTSDALWHIAGVRPYVAQGTPIYVLDKNQTRLEKFIARPRTIVPDTLAKSPRAPKLIPVADRTVIGEGNSRLEIYPIRGHGDARMMMVFFPTLGLLYGSSNDLGSGNTSATFNSIELVGRVDSLHLPVKSYVAIHTDQIPYDQFRSVVKQSPVISVD
jgi:hypothetical protein